MFPLSDTHRTRTVPFVNFLFIGVNIAVFILQITSQQPEAFINQYAFTPSEFSFLDVRTYWTAFTSMWLHGGFVHIGFNLWFLHIFGDNIEDEIGHFKYFFFYIAAGLAAVLGQYLVGPMSDVPMIGASGAISGVTGAYFVLYKYSKIKALVPSFFGLLHVMELPSTFFLGYWFVIQVFSGIGSFTSVDSGGGVAFFAHIGGFLFGYVFGKWYSNKVMNETKLYVN